MPALLLLTAVLWLTAGSIALAAWVDSPLLHNSSRFACSKPGFYDQTACTDAGGTWNPNRKWTGGWGTDTGTYGPIVCATCHEKNAVNIKRVKQTLTADSAAVDDFPIEADASRQPISFLDARESSADFGDDSSRPHGNARSDKICEACHSKTSYHNYDISKNTGGNGHFNNSDCISCHTHNAGFRPLACDACHGNPPTTGTPGSSTPTTGLAYNPQTTGSATAGKHAVHVTTLEYACSNCHNNYVMPQKSTAAGLTDKSDISISFSNFGVTTGTYTGQAGVSYNNVEGSGTKTCAAVYCHGNWTGSGGTNKSPTWDGPAAVCGDCHANPPATGQHVTHVDKVKTIVAAGKECVFCHAGAPHVNGSSEIVFNVAENPWLAGVSYTGTPNMLDTASPLSKCTNLYCHTALPQGWDLDKDGIGPPELYNNNDVLKWDGDTSCMVCHYLNPTQGLSTGSHPKHVTLGVNCNACHGDYWGAKHGNHNVDVVFDSINPTGSYSQGLTNPPGNGYGNCTTTYCHAAASPTWGATGTTTCETCHGATNNGDLSVSSSVGHGIHYNSATVPTKIDQANDFSSSYAYGCSNCHPANGANGKHAGGPVNAKRAAEIDIWTGTPKISAYTEGAVGIADNRGFNFTNGTCTTVCHTRDGASGAPIAGNPVWNGAKTSPNCGVCHNKAGDAGPLWSAPHTTHINSYSANANLSCNACHSVTASNNTTINGAAGRAQHPNQTKNVDFNVFSGGSWSSSQCSNTYCHSDGTTTASPTHAAISWSGTTTCASCHAAQPATDRHTSHINDITYNYRCVECHAVTVTDATDASVAIADKSQHVDKTKDVNWGTRSSGSTAYANAATSCSVYCHSNGQTNAAPFTGNFAVKWDTATTLGCNICHDGNAIGTYAHDLHLVAGGNTAAIGRAIQCGDCHIRTAPNGTTLMTRDYHVNRLVNIRFDDTFNVLNLDTDSPTYNGSPATGNGVAKTPGTVVGSCNNVYCHSVGNLADNTGTGAVVGVGAGPATFRAVAWNATGLDCTSCHGTSSSKAHPDYTSGAAGSTTANSHVKHVEGSNMPCFYCHQDTTASPAAFPTLPTTVVYPGGTHLDRKETVVYNATVVGASASYNPAVGAKSCSNLYCHGSSTPQWGGAPLNCDACHGANSALANSHGVHYNVATLATAINANNDSTASDYVFQCGSCHNGTSHAGGAVSAVQAAEVSIIGGGIYNAAVLEAGTDRGFKYTAGTCKTNVCHQDGRGGNANYNSATLQWSVTSLPADCTGCHDNNAAAAQTMATGAHTAHVSNANHGASKTCNTCHNATVDGTDRVVIDKSLHVNGLYNIAILASVDGNGATTNWSGANCNAVYCHSTGQSTTVANDPAPTYATATWATPATGACGTCHKVAEGSGLTSGSHAAHLGTTMGTATVNGCGDCHTDAADNAGSYPSALHVNKKIDVSNTYNSAVVGSGDPGDGYFTCAAASCHDDGTGNPAETPRWGTAVNNCTECHKSDMISGSHAIHLGTTINDTAIGCGTCHADAVKGTTAPTGGLHLNDSVNVYNSAVGDFGGDYSAGKLKGSPYGSCATTYCHGNTLKDRTDAGLDVSPLWGATLGSNGNNCDVCHGFPPSGGGTHPANNDCDACHFHTNNANNGFDDVLKHIDGTVQIDGGDSCLDCHGSGKYKDPNTNHPDHADHTNVYVFLNGKTVTDGDYGKAAEGWYSVTYDVSGNLVAGCGQCHPGVQASHPSGGLTEIDLDPAGETIASPNAKLNNSSPSYASGKCANVYCHSDGNGTFVASGSLPVWGGAAENMNCASCHGNSPTTNAHELHAVGIHYDTLYDDDGYGLMATAPTGKATSGGADAAHGNSVTSDVIGCQSCHYSTVAVEYNSGNSTCITCHYSVPGTPATGSPSTGNALAVIVASSSAHLNGAKTVAFQTMAGQKSKAQLRNDITTVTELNESWARYNSATLDNTAYKLSASHDNGKRAPGTYDSAGKTCSTVDCHNGKPATWTDTNVSCNYCHTSVPK